MKRLLSHLLAPRSMILGVTVFYFVCASTMWASAPLWGYHREMFVATVLLISAVALVVNRLLSDLLTVIISGQLPFLFLGEFWMLSLNAELPLLSAEHIRAFLRLVAGPDPTPIFFLTLSSVMLSYSVVSVVGRQRKLRARDPFDLLEN